MEETENINKEQELSGIIPNKEKIICFNLTLLSFIFYINNLPKVNGESINRLKYYFNVLYNSDLNTEKILNDFTLKEDMIDLLSKMMLANTENKYEYKRIFICLIIIFFSYKMILNFIAKKNIFTDIIENKIKKFVNYIVYYFDKEINETDITNIVLDDLFEFCKNLFDDGYFKKLKFRQNLRHNYKDFLEYNESIKAFETILSFDKLINSYTMFKNNQKHYDYEIDFFNNCNAFTYKYYNINILQI